MKKINVTDLVCMNDYCTSHHLIVRLDYACTDNLLFGEAIYRPNAALWLHKDLAQAVLCAAQNFYDHHGFRLVVFDGLRTVEAQAKMLTTRRVLENPHWLEKPALLSSPGSGGHPRAMAVDVTLMDEAGDLLDMGTPFDYLAKSPHPAENPAHRDYEGHTPEVMRNRGLLTRGMMDAAETASCPLWPLPQEWWDFRLPPEVYGQYAPLSEDDLLPAQKLMA